MNDLELEVRKLVPEDGDVIVVRSTRRVSHEQAMHIHGMMTDALKKVGKKAAALVLDDGITIEILKTSALPSITDQRVAA